jgi:hypothetical protein
MTVKQYPTDMVEQEIAKAVRAVERKGNGPLVPQGEIKQGIADDLAKFIEQHADDMMREAEQHRTEAYAYAKEIRDRTAEQIARLKAYTDSIKASQAEMAEVRMRFVSAGTGAKEEGHGKAKAEEQR